MKYNELKVGRNKTPTRVGRGISAGQGKTAGRGTKGQNSRAGSSRKPGFEGGSNPLIQRMPKLRGFKSHRPKVEEVYTGQLNSLAGKVIDNETLFKAEIVESPYAKVKLLVGGDIVKPVEVKLQAASKSAETAIKKAGGSFIAVDQVPMPKTTKEHKRRSDG